MEFEDASVVGREECPSCGSSDNVAVYSDGHKHCFSPGCKFHTGPDGSTTDREWKRGGRVKGDMIEGEFRTLPTRGLSKEACEKFGVRTGKLGKEHVLAMDYKDQDGNLVAQKIRKLTKDFVILGDPKQMGLFGQHLWGPTGRSVVVTEGELDAVALAQVMDLRWPVVSIPNGASNAKKDLAKAMDWLLGYQDIVLAFDSDDAGRKAIAECAPLFPPGRIKVAEMPTGCKDANEAILKDCERELLENVRYRAREWRPDGIVRVKDFKDRILATAPMGRPYPFEGVTKATFGRQLGQVIGLGAGTGVGKTDLFTQMIDYDTRVLNIPTGVLYLEQDITETAQRIAGKAIGKTLHVQDGSWSQADLEAAVDALEARPVCFYDNFGAMDWDTIEARIRYMVQVEGCEHIYLDHLTALAAAAQDERIALEKIMAGLASLAKSLKVVIHFVSHLTTPDQGPPHEEGGRVTIRQFKGSRAIGFWSHFLWGLERNQQNEDEQQQRVTTLRCLKDRHTGRGTGKTFQLLYTPGTGRLDEYGGFSENTRQAADEVGF